MSRIILDGRYILGIAGMIMRREELKISYKRLDWEKMYRLSDYHKVVNIVYLGLLGHGDKIPKKWKESFFLRYQEGLRVTEVCDQAELEILNLFEMRTVPCIILSSNRLRGLYEVSEAAGPHNLELLVDQSNYALAKGYLIDLGYEWVSDKKGAGVRFKGREGLVVDLLYDLPFKPPYYKKAAYKLLGRSAPLEGFSNINELNSEDTLLFMIVRTVYDYVSNDATIQQMLDIYVLHQYLYEWSHRDLTVRLRDFRIEELTGELLLLAYMWFGPKDAPFLKEHEFSQEQLDELDVLEKRLLTRGIINQETNIQALGLEKAIEAELEKERVVEQRKRFRERMRKKKQEFTKTMKWLFPGYMYMCGMYPILEKAPVLMPLFWMRRLTRFMFLDKE